jgi:5-methylcytosine-specific restriction endonuclease McrA
VRAVSLKRQKQNREFKPIHDAVIERDDGCILEPAQRAIGHPGWPELRCGGSLIVHHVISRARAPELALEPSNLVTLCWDHHVAVHANVALATERGLLKSASRPSGPPK